VKARLARLSPRKALGVYVGERAVAVSEVAATPLGPVEVGRWGEPYEGDDLRPVLGRLLAAAAGRRKPRRLPLALGLAGQRVFFSTRPIRTTDTQASAEVLLHEVLQSPNLSADDMAVDLLKVQPGKRKLASIVACRKKYLAGLLADLDVRRVRLVRAEPAPCALLRVAQTEQRVTRRGATVLRVFLGDSQGLAVVTASGLPLVWRFFPLPAGDEATAVCSAARALHVLTGPCGSEAALDAVLVHGRDDLRGRLEAQGLGARLGSRLLWSAGPALDGAAVAYGLALGCLGPPGEAFDLARSLKPPPSLRDLFPWGEVAVQAAMLLCMGLFLNFHLHHLRGSLDAARTEVARRDRLAAVPDARLEKEKHDLQQQADAVRRFLADRVVWAAYLHDLPGRLPEQARLVSLEGRCELPGPSRNGAAPTPPRTSLLLRAVAPTPSGGVVPPEVNALVSALQNDELVRGRFPQVNLGEIAPEQAAPGMPSMTAFTVSCFPRAAQGKGRKPAGG
jgi:hypothetical protein